MPSEKAAAEQQQHQQQRQQLNSTQLTAGGSASISKSGLPGRVTPAELRWTNLDCWSSSSPMDTAYGQNGWFTHDTWALRTRYETF